MSTTTWKFAVLNRPLTHQCVLEPYVLNKFQTDFVQSIFDVTAFEEFAHAFRNRAESRLQPRVYFRQAVVTACYCVKGQSVESSALRHQNQYVPSIPGRKNPPAFGTDSFIARPYVLPFFPNNIVMAKAAYRKRIHYPSHILLLFGGIVKPIIGHKAFDGLI